MLMKLDPDPRNRGLRRYYGESYLEQLRQSLSAEAADRISFTGAVPHARLPELYRSADAFVLPAVYPEAFSLPILEAMASGLPVVATRLGGPATILEDGATGLLVEPHDPVALANAVVRLAERSGEREALGSSARQRAVDRYSGERVARELLDYYRLALGGRAGR
jgi:glycosyltransferase involved in cell wall biosynthesis